ncbi:MAG: CBS domain-containing protein, partial [Armatimonadetes bacterium]|nr:CBS domain-containing protein [Armatimonadota bacterium]
QRKLYGVKASEIMKKDPVVINENMDIIDVIELMLKEKISRLPVIRKDKLIGFLTYHDLLKTLLSLEEGRFLEYQPLSDNEIAYKVTLALRKNIELQIHNLKVRSGKGIIYLEGTVSSPEDYKTATEIAQSLPGVKEVENYLLIEHILD